MIDLLPRVSTARTIGFLLAVIFLPVLFWPGLINNLFAADFMPHIYCLSQQPSLVTLYVATNLVIGLSYVTISVTLTYFVYKKRNLPFHWMFLAFGLFIIACGATHFMDIWTLWNPTYWLAGGISLMTAVVSVATACLLPPLIPKALTLPSPADLIHANQELEREIAERKRADAEVKDLNTILSLHTRRLENANQELEAFSYSVSHDLRAPLRAMDGFARILLEDHRAELSPEALECAEIIVANARQMGELIDDLLGFARLSRQPLNKQTVVPADLVHTLVDEFHREQNRQRIRIEIGEMPDCQADPALLKQVYANLLSNALKYTRSRDETYIEIGCLENYENGGPVYFVKDNGIGFDMRYAQKLFGVFQRLHAAEEYEGTGVGLALVQRIVNRHGGRVWAEASPDQGATFYFMLEGNE